MDNATLRERENRERLDQAHDKPKKQDYAKKAELLDVLYPPLPKARPRFPLPLTYREVGRGYHPGRGLGLSICFHLFLLVLLLASRSVILDSPRVVVELPSHPDQLGKVLYLPVSAAAVKVAAARAEDRDKRLKLPLDCAPAAAAVSPIADRSRWFPVRHAPPSASRRFFSPR